jgi:hypothetical protein
MVVFACGVVRIVLTRCIQVVSDLPAAAGCVPRVRHGGNHADRAGAGVCLLKVHACLFVL